MSSRSVPSSLRREVVERAQSRCEYCGIPESDVFSAHEIDHVIAIKHGGETRSGNLALSCTLCNKHKGSDIASLDTETGEIVGLYHPRLSTWREHFELGTDGRIFPRSQAGRVTVRLLQLNHPDRVEERKALLTAGDLTASTPREKPP